MAKESACDFTEVLASFRGPWSPHKLLRAYVAEEALNKADSVREAGAYGPKLSSEEGNTFNDVCAAAAEG